VKPVTQCKQNVLCIFLHYVLNKHSKDYELIYFGIKQFANRWKCFFFAKFYLSQASIPSIPAKLISSSLMCSCDQVDCVFGRTEISNSAFTANRIIVAEGMGVCRIACSNYRPL
jgi:hypothetical protein